MENKISIIIPVFNCLQYTKKCLESIYRHGTDTDAFEIIVVDNKSTDGTKEYLKDLKKKYFNINCIRNAENIGFAKASNLGARTASHDLLIMLNNDTEVSEDWSEALAKTLLKNENNCIVGAKCLYPDRTIQHAGVVFGDDKRPYHLYKGYPEYHPAVCREREFKSVTAACMMIRKKDFFLHGGFNEQYINGFEDVDFCLKVISSGKKIIYQPDCQIIHYESKTQSRNSENNHNLNLLLSIWSSYIQPDASDLMCEDGQILNLGRGKFVFPSHLVDSIIIEGTSPCSTHRKFLITGDDLEFCFYDSKDNKEITVSTKSFIFVVSLIYNILKVLGLLKIYRQCNRKRKAWSSRIKKRLFFVERPKI